VLDRWIGDSAPPAQDADKAKAILKLLHASDGAGPARVELKQPWPRANVLFTLEYGHVVHHWVQTITGDTHAIDVPVRAAWAPGVTLHALVRNSDATAPDGGPGSRTLDATLDLAIP